MGNGQIPDGPRVTFDDIVDALQRLDIGPGNVTYMHSSLSSMGFVEGGADTVIDAFLHVLGPEGTFCVPTIVYAGQGPRPPFDVENTTSEVGRITETTRLRPDARRSINPTHSVAAIGAKAEWITTGHDRGKGRPSPWGELAFGYESPWQRFYELNATCVLLGVDWEVNTMFHYQQCVFVEPYWAEFAVEPVFPYYGRTLMGIALEEAGIVRKQQLGSATVTCVESQPMVDTTSEVLEEDPARFFAEGKDVDWVQWLRTLPARRQRLRAGAAKRAASIPPLKAEALPLLDPIHMRALVVESADCTTAIVLCDLHSLGREQIGQARRLVEEHTGIPAAHVMIACTHNHAGPDTVSHGSGSRDAARSAVVTQIADVVASARDQIQEVRTGTATLDLEGIIANRRIRLADGDSVTLRRFVPASWQQLKKNKVGVVNRQLTVLRLEGLSGEPIALLTSLGCHNDTGGMYAPIGWSGDFFGHAMLTLERLYPDCTALIGFGAGGDVDSDFVPYLNLSTARNEYPFQRFGRSLATQIATACERVAVDEGGRVEMRAVSVPVQLRESATDSQTETAELQAIAIGSLVVLGVPGELFAQTGLEVGTAQQGDLILFGLANDDLGYIPPPSAFQEGGYELEPGPRSQVGEEAEPAIKSAISGLLSDLADRRADG